MKLGHASLTTLFPLYFEGLLLDANHCRFEKWQVSGEFYLTCVLETKSVQMVKESFSDLINYPRKDFFKSFNASVQKLLRIECSIEGTVIIRATKKSKRLD